MGFIPMIWFLFFFDKDIPPYEKVENSIKSLLLSLSKTFES